MSEPGAGALDGCAHLVRRGAADVVAGGERAFHRQHGKDVVGNQRRKLLQVGERQLWQIDALIRMRTEPAFELDMQLLETTAAAEAERKHKALLDLSGMLNLDTFATDEEAAENIRAELASAPRFSALLEGLGADVPM